MKRTPLVDEPVGGRLIGVLYCPARAKTFQFFPLGQSERKAKIGHTAVFVSDFFTAFGRRDTGVRPPQPCRGFPLSVVS
jgi:hypothetical protein